MEHVLPIFAGEELFILNCESDWWFGVIANETEPFCSSCTRLRLSSNGFLYGCLSNAANHDMRPVLQEPHHQAMARLQSLLVRALGDKQDLSFTGEVTVMKFIGG